MSKLINPSATQAAHGCACEYYFDYTRQGQLVCYVGFSISPKNKVAVFLRYLPKCPATQKMLGKMEKEINKELDHGKFSVENMGDMTVCTYTRYLSNCFGYWRKKENYTLLVNDGVKKIQMLSERFEKLKEENNG